MCWKFQQIIHNDRRNFLHLPSAASLWKIHYRLWMIFLSFEKINLMKRMQWWIKRCGKVCIDCAEKLKSSFHLSVFHAQPHGFDFSVYNFFKPPYFRYKDLHKLTKIVIHMLCAKYLPDATYQGEKLLALAKLAGGPRQSMQHAKKYL